MWIQSFKYQNSYRVNKWGMWNQWLNKCISSATNFKFL